MHAKALTRHAVWHQPTRWKAQNAEQVVRGRIRESLAERRFPNRLGARGWLGGHLATVEHGKPVWKPALRRSTKVSRMRPYVPCGPRAASTAAPRENRNENHAQPKPHGRSRPFTRRTFHRLGSGPGRKVKARTGTKA